MLEFGYRCSMCGAAYEITPQRMLCDGCSREQADDEPLRGILEVEISGSVGAHWRIADLLPVEERWFPSIPVGNTPLWQPERMRTHIGFPGLYLKDDTANPTGSLKDRASYLVAAYARSQGIRDIVVASTGNAGSSMAGIGAAAGLNVRLFIPESAPRAKLVQALQYGAQVERVSGTYDQAYDESLAYSREHGGLSRNTGYNPLTIEGKKTAALEIFRQLGGCTPDIVFVPVGDGVILSGLYKGFEDLVTLRLAERVPRLVAVQSEGSSAIARAFDSERFGPPVAAETVADSISVDVPRAGYFAVERLRRHDGETVVVDDESILAAQLYLSTISGLFAEPAAAASVAGFLEVRRSLPADATVVLCITGSGLKDIESAKKEVGLE